MYVQIKHIQHSEDPTFKAFFVTKQTERPRSRIMVLKVDIHSQFSVILPTYPPPHDESRTFRRSTRHSLCVCLTVRDRTLEHHFRSTSTFITCTLYLYPPYVHTHTCVNIHGHFSMLESSRVSNTYHPLEQMNTSLKYTEMVGLSFVTHPSCRHFKP